MPCTQYTTDYHRLQPAIDNRRAKWYSCDVMVTIDSMPRQTANSVPVTIRFPADLHQRLSAYAEEHGRPFTAQVLYWLRHDLEMAERGSHPKP